MNQTTDLASEAKIVIKAPRLYSRVKIAIAVLFLVGLAIGVYIAWIWAAANTAA